MQIVAFDRKQFQAWIKGSGAEMTWASVYDRISFASQRMSRFVVWCVLTICIALEDTVFKESVRAPQGSFSVLKCIWTALSTITMSLSG